VSTITCSACTLIDRVSTITCSACKVGGSARAFDDRVFVASREALAATGRGGVRDAREPELTSSRRRSAQRSARSA
jgi:hypothetical protein